MHTHRQAERVGRSRMLSVWGGVFAALLFIGGVVRAQELSVLDSFTGGTTPSTPNAGIVEDSAGNFYGTTSAGGASNRGTVYKIAPDGTITVLHSFGGSVPVGSSGSTAVVNLVSSSGGGSSSSGGATVDDTSASGITIIGPGGGTLTLNGTNTYTGGTIVGTGTISGTIYGTVTLGGAAGINAGGTYIGVLNGNSGTSGTVADGSAPSGNIVLGLGGFLYGTTPSGGPGGGGIVYKLSTDGVYSIIGIFTAGTTSSSANTGSSGFYPLGGVIQGKDGNLYGTTSQGGDFGLGVVFEINATSSAYSVIHDFTTGGDAANPYTGLVQDTLGNIYGTTAKGGTAGYGTVYLIDPHQIFSVIYNFAAPSYMFTLNTTYGANTLGGYSPISPLAVGSDGNLYGTASGATYGSGAAYKITPQGQFSILHYFGDGSVGGDGAILGVIPAFSTVSLGFTLGTSGPTLSPVPADGFVAATDGNLYGVTYAGGSAGKGAVFQMTPAGQVTIIHSFGDGTVSNDGASPVGLMQGADGNFYGATFAGGTASDGTAFKITTALPMFTSPLQVSTATGVAFTYSMAATQGPDTFTVTNLPAGFAFDGTSVISATSPVAGTYTATLTATNATGATTVPLVIHVTAPPVITSLLDAVGSTTSLGYAILATGGANAFTATGLPPGVSVDPATGAFYGIPTAVGTYQVTVSATNAVGTGTAVVNVTILSTAPTPGQEYMTIHNFQDGSVTGEGNFPSALISSADKTLYGVTPQGGSFDDGTIFSLSPAGLAHVLATFNGTNGAEPQGILQTADGTLYGAARYGGGSANKGTLFKVTPDGTISVLHVFGDGSVTNDGANPEAGLVLASDGNFYGTTQSGGSANKGTVFQMTPAGVVTILHSFADGSVANDGEQPVAALVQNTNLYLNGTVTLVGTTLQGGTKTTSSTVNDPTVAPNGSGVVFSIAIPATGASTLTILHSFGAPPSGDAELPRAALTVTAKGIFGTTSSGGSAGKGTIFSIGFPLPTYTILHSFGDGTVANDGENPSSGLIVAPPVNVGSGVTFSFTNAPVVFYGVTQNGGTAGSGTLFSCAASVITTTATTTVLHNFGDVAFTGDGTMPLGGLCIGPDGNLYGTTIGGGAGAGTAYGIEINQGSPLFVPSPYVCSGTIPAGMTFDSTTGVLSGTPLHSDALGIYSVTITPTGLTNATAQTITIKLNQSYTSWTAAHPGASTAIVGTGGNTGAGGSDNVPMVVKYLTGVDPTKPMQSGDYAMLPSIGMDSTTQPGSTFLTLTWRQSGAATGVGVALYSSTDMVTWAPVGGDDLIYQAVGAPDSAGNTKMEMGVRMGVTMPGVGQQQFIRLQVTPPQ